MDTRSLETYEVGIGLKSLGIETFIFELYIVKVEPSLELATNVRALEEYFT